MSADRCRWAWCTRDRVKGWFCAEHEERSHGTTCLDAEAPDPDR